jgi:hypothetical protein
MVDWLVPISRRTRFVDRSGRTLTQRFELVRTATLSGRLTSVGVEVRGALTDAQPGDTVWLLWPEHDVGVMAVGRARPGRPRRGEPPRLLVTLDRTPTRLLVVDPMPAAFVRRWIPDLRGAFRLDLRPRAHQAIRAWVHERGERDDALLAPLGTPSWRTSAARGSGSRPIDDPVLSTVVPFLRSQDFAVGLVTRDGATRLVARRGRDVLVVHAVSADRSRLETYRAYGAVRAHRWVIERDHGDLHARSWPWLAFTAKPSPDLVAFLEDEGVIVTWRQSGGRVEMSEASKQRWYQQLGVR